MRAVLAAVVLGLIAGPSAAQQVQDARAPRLPETSSNGSSTRVVPITAREFRGIQPDLRLVHDSATGLRVLPPVGGDLGTGWSLQDLSHTQRTSADETGSIDTSRDAASSEPAYRWQLAADIVAQPDSPADASSSPAAEPNKLDPTTRYDRYVSEAELNSIKSTGCLSWCTDGDETYFTTDGYSSATTAQQKLALPAKPAYHVIFSVEPGTLAYGPRTVAPNYGFPGGGVEYYSEQAVHIHDYWSSPLGP